MVKISFVIPAYNEEARIGACIEAIQKEVARAGLPIQVGVRELEPGESEIVVVNNASTDRTKEAASRYAGARVVDEPTKGLVHARAAGFAATNGELVANVDADVLLPEGWLTTALNEFTNKKLVALSGPFVYHDLSPVLRALTKLWYFIGWTLTGMRIQGGNFIIRRDAWQREGGFDTRIAFYGEDTDIGRRMRRQGVVKWSWRLWVYASGRRLAQEGALMAAFHYASNHLWVTLFGKPFTKKYKDIRTDTVSK